jgi:hypothetical protein
MNPTIRGPDKSPRVNQFDLFQSSSGQETAGKRIDLRSCLYRSIDTALLSSPASETSDMKSPPGGLFV